MTWPLRVKASPIRRTVVNNKSVQGGSSAASTREIRSGVSCFRVLVYFRTSYAFSKAIHTFPTAKGQTLVIPRPCAPRQPVPDSRRESVSLLRASQTMRTNSAPSRHLDRNATASRWRPDDREEENGDPVLDELKGMGEKGLGDPASTRTGDRNSGGPEPMRGLVRARRIGPGEEIPITPLQNR